MDKQSIILIVGLIAFAVAVYFIIGWYHPTAKRFDHDGNGKIGGSLPAADRGLDELVREYKRLYGKKPDHRWGESTLRKKIAARKAGNE